MMTRTKTLANVLAVLVILVMCLSPLCLGMVDLLYKEYVIFPPQRRQLRSDYEQLRMAILEFEADHDRYPHDLTELVPVYLATLPAQPNSQPFYYFAQDTSFTLGYIRSDLWREHQYCTYSSNEGQPVSAFCLD